ncbi:alpha/beta hydrolase [Mycobacterium vulneris]|uniref:Alpha/beta hydrolase n=1 Tax=Mycolicibacterium vulneris TaxID=547163 RepID=A0A1X2LC65_9MYCO|nr:alpha/beta hydrolase [Mycolicibacterium vulneris]OSC31600.1 alpha/beta hydrolase [Mycolicibacterium vulneris]
MAKNPRQWVTAVATVLLVGGAVATAAKFVRHNRTTPHAVIPSLELTPINRSGGGSPLLLLHGITAIWRAWSPVLPSLEPYHDVIVPTLPGHGGGPPLDPQTEPSVQALADGIEEVLDRLSLPKVHIAGNSLGGWVGIELARRGRASSLVLFSPAGAWRSQRSTELRAIGIGLLVGSAALCTSRADAIASNAVLRRILLSRQVAHPDHVPPEELAAWFRAIGVAPALVPLLRAIPRCQVQPLPADRDYPVRLVWGDRDRVLPFNGFGEAMIERLPGAELVRLPGVGHVPMSDDPTRVAKLILEVTHSVDNATASTQGGDGDAQQRR